MRLQDRIYRLGTSVEQPRTPEEQRFNVSDQQEILNAVATASPGELREAEAAVLSNAGVPGYNRPLWRGRDKPFRAQLAAAIALRRKSWGTVVAPKPSPEPRQITGTPKQAVLLIDTRYSKHPANPARLELEKQQMQKVLERANAKGIDVFEVILPWFQTDARFAKLSGRNWLRIEKTTNSAFASTNIGDELRKRGIEKLVVMGLNEDRCVYATARDAVGEGFKVYTSSDVIQHDTDPGGERVPQWYYQSPNVTVADTANELPVFDRHAR